MAALAPTPRTAKNTQSGKTMAMPTPGAVLVGGTSGGAWALATISGTTPACARGAARGVEEPSTRSCRRPWRAAERQAKRARLIDAAATLPWTGRASMHSLAAPNASARHAAKEGLRPPRRDRSSAVPG